jgi:hypothetical protein
MVDSYEKDGVKVFPSKDMGNGLVYVPIYILNSDKNFSAVCAYENIDDAIDCKKYLDVFKGSMVVFELPLMKKGEGNQGSEFVVFSNKKKEEAVNG